MHESYERRGERRRSNDHLPHHFKRERSSHHFHSSKKKHHDDPSSSRNHVESPEKRQRHDRDLKPHPPHEDTSRLKGHFSSRSIDEPVKCSPKIDYFAKIKGPDSGEDTYEEIPDPAGGCSVSQLFQADLANTSGSSNRPSVSYGKNLLQGEGSKLAAYVASERRIPRRGEVGYSQEKISQLEAAGFVMSGNRNKRVTAVRLKKEGQVKDIHGRLALEEGRGLKVKENEDKVLAHLKSLVKK